MSNISDRHTLNPFIAGKSEALVQQRLCKVGYKLTADMKKQGVVPLPSVCVSVPHIDPSAVTGAILAGFMPSIVSMIEAAQDGIVRALNDSSGGTLAVVTDSDISLEACIAFLGAESVGTRLSAESISQWFTSAVEDNLSVLVADKLGFADITEDNQPAIDSRVKVYLDICKLIVGKNLTRNSLGESQKKAIRTCVKIAADSGRESIGARIVAKLDELEKKIDIADVLELDI